MMRYTQVALCIIVLAMSGVSLVESGRNNEARIPLFKYELTLGITNQNYTDSLLNTLSVDYLILSLEVKGALYSIYGCDSCKTHKFYRGVSAMTFSNQTGTVLVKATLTFQSNETNAHLVKSLLMKAINGSNEINNLKFKPEFSEAISGSTPTTNTTTSRPTNTTTTRPTNTTTSRPHNAASSFFYQYPITLTSFFRICVSFFLFFLISCSF
ncbi:transcription initiation factor TFIID subunit 12 [Tachysurus ichikawai]